MWRGGSSTPGVAFQQAKFVISCTAMITCHHPQLTLGTASLESLDRGGGNMHV